MRTDTLIGSLLWQAGVIDDPKRSGITIAQATWLPNSESSYIEEAVSEVIQILSSLNHIYNGDRPSESRERVSCIPVTVIFAIEEIRRMLHEAYEKSPPIEDAEVFKKMERRITIAWNGVIAGDIDDLFAYVAEEEWAD